MRLLIGVFLAVLGASAVPMEAARPLHVKLEPSGTSTVVGGACVFGVEFTEMIVHGNLLEFLDKAGEFKKTIIAGNFVTKVTNLDTDKALTLNISGQFVFTPNPDGSMTIAAHGRNLFFTVEPEPFVVFHRGRAVLTVTASGDLLALVFNELNGQSADICDALARAN